jgi:putative SOS response-associated peptidase YedK
MCNAYEIGRRVGKNPMKNSLLPGASLDLPSEPRLVRRTDPAPVITADGELATMRWGFERPTLGTINNSRADKLHGPMWSNAFRERRCVIPANAFYEWSGPKGRKRTHRFTRTDGDWFWIAGIWEVSHEFGPCFSMITTDANERMAPIHDRMPALLEEGEVEDYLAGAMSRFAPLAESLKVEDSSNPLVKSKGMSVQGELF